MEFSKGGLVEKLSDSDRKLIDSRFYLPEGLVKKYGTKFMEAISIQKENTMSSELHVELTPESTKIYFLRSQLQDLIDVTDWDSFKSKDTLVPTIEVHALLINAVEKLSKINVNFVTKEK